jgi:D-sedoheptulose 7-phosphate isomerase
MAMGNPRLETIEAYLREGAALRLESVRLENHVLRAAEAISQTFRSGGKLLLFGNGGSAADAQHIAAEFSGRFAKDRAPMPALALTVNPSAVTAIANDYAFEEVFERQVRGLAKPGDVVVGISTSGASKNVLRGLDAAREVGAMAIGLCGSKGEMTLHTDLVLSVPSETTPLIQEVHIAIGHLLALLVEEDLFG